MLTLTDYVTVDQMQKIYIVAIYTYTLYSCANNYYKTANTAFRICRTGYVVSGSVYNKWLRWKYNQTKPIKEKEPPSKEVEMMETSPANPVVHLTPRSASSLDELVENYFVTT